MWQQYKKSANYCCNERSFVLGISGGSSLELSFHFIKRFPKDYILYLCSLSLSERRCRLRRLRPHRDPDS